MADLNTIGGLHYEMMRRCYNASSVAYKDFGGKGIGVCEEWHDREIFKKWCIDNGWRKGLRVNRIDSSKGYSPDNCYLGEKNKAKHGYSQMVKKRAKNQKLLKADLGLDRFSDSPLYKKYVAMHSRCEQKSHPSYDNYGGRGIYVCDEWCGKYGFINFYKWAIESGWKEGLTIDRIDNNQGYSPNNCKWSTSLEQSNNRRNSLKYIHNGEEMTLMQIAKFEGVKYSRLYGMVRKKGTSIKNALIQMKE